MEADANKTCSFAAWSLKSLFDYKGEKGKNITVQCKLCKPREKFLSTSKSSTSNLKKHLVRKHSSGYERQLLELGPAGRALDAPGQSGPPLERLGEAAADSAVEVEEERPAKQPKSSCYVNKASQRRLNALVFAFMVDSLQPFSLLEAPSFLRLLDGLHSSRGLLSPAALAGKLCWASHSMAEALGARLQEARSVCCTADLWAAGGRSYLAVTCHWLQESTLERRSAALACALLQTPPTCHALLAKLGEVQSRFGLSDKLGCVVADSGSAYAPLFSDLGLGGAGGGADGEWERKGVAVEEGGVVFASVSQLLLSDVKELQFLLPEHQPCPAQLLSRLAQEQVQAALGGGPSGALYRGAMAKVAALCSLAQGPPTAAPCLEELAALPRRVPRAALWSWEYRAVRGVLSLGDGQARAACEQLGAEPLSGQELLLLQEYADVLQPLAYALDFLQAEKKCILGYLLPTLLTLKAKLGEIRPFVRFCAPLIDALLAAILARFPAVLASRHAKMAAATVPKLRLWWLPQEQREEARAMLLEEAAAEERCQEVQEAQTSDSDSEAEAKFFGFAEQEGEARSSVEVEVLTYLQDTDKALASLNKYPTVRRLFLKYNTTLPAGGARVQRLFSHNGRVLTPQLSGIADEHFEQVLLLRYNQDLCPLTNEGWHWS